MDFDFSFFLVIATLVTGITWGSYLLYLKSQRREFDEQTEPWLVEYARSFFPVVLIVLILRSFLVEPFRIPSGSMMPTLLIGDFILVNKFAYGIRLPVLHNKVVEMDLPQRGDIVVFRYPKDPTVDYIKRVIGIPGDKVSYHEKKLFINDLPIEQVSLGRSQHTVEGEDPAAVEELLENLTPVKHAILLNHAQPTVEVDYKVPAGHYFMMGDNRDNSNDSRYWGTVPEENLVGKAFFIWMNWDTEHGGINFSRIGTVLK
jgi:signal peptidase I